MTDFLSDESGAVSLDWLVLTSVLVVTGLAVVGTVRTGVESASLGVSTQLRGQVIRSSFATAICPGGLPALQEREDVRAAFTGELPLDVASWTQEHFDMLPDVALRAEFERRFDPNFDPAGTAWTLDQVETTAIGCALVARGLD